MVDHGLGLNNLAQEGATTGQVIKWDGSDWNPGADDNSGGGLFSYGNDSLTIAFVNDSTGDSILIIREDENDTVSVLAGTGKTLAFGSDGLTIMDSALVDSILYFVSVGATPDDTTWITNVFLDSVRAGAFGGGGSGWDWADSTGMVAVSYTHLRAHET